MPSANRLLQDILAATLASSGGSAKVKREFRADTQGTHTFTLPNDITSPITGYLVGIGSGGGGATGRQTYTSATGGQAGGNGEACNFFPVRLVPSVTYTINIGAAGVGSVRTGYNIGTNGTSGGDVTFGTSNGTVLVLKGGVGGSYDNSLTDVSGFDTDIFQVANVVNVNVAGTFSQPSHADRAQNGIASHYSVVGIGNTVRTRSAYSFGLCGESGIFYGESTSNVNSGSAGAGSPFEDGYGADGGKSLYTTSSNPTPSGIDGADATLFGCGGGGGGGLRLTAEPNIPSRRGGNGKVGFLEIYY